MDTSFTTKVTIVPLQEPLGYDQQWLTLGSCFSDNIGRRLERAGFTTCMNPFGVLFNPRSISLALRRIISGKEIRADELFQQGSVWNHFAFSNLHSSYTPESTLEGMNRSINKAVDQYKHTRVLILTFGTAWVYEDNLSGEVVANCHKLPADRFRRRKLSVDEIVADYTALFQELPTDMRIILTVSPVRHWKDGAHENTLSKSILQLAVDELATRFSGVHYFPAYELLIDELRDYRFYNDDMIHPSDRAIDYIWQSFARFAFSETTRLISNEVENYRLMENHRSIHPDSEENLAFKRKTAQRREELLHSYPFLHL